MITISQACNIIDYEEIMSKYSADYLKDVFVTCADGRKIAFAEYMRQHLIDEYNKAATAGIDPDLGFSELLDVL